VRQRGHIANGQFPNLATTDSLGFYDRGLAIFEYLPGIDQERLTCRRERDSLALSLEQLYHQFAFQLVDLLAERWLRNVKPIGGTGEVQLLGRGDEVFNLVKLHKQSCS
jgi:hypothetical protein